MDGYFLSGEFTRFLHSEINLSPVTKKGKAISKMYRLFL